MKPSLAPVVYLAGPLTTHGDVSENRTRAVLGARWLVSQGFTPIVPHFFLELDSPPRSYDFWMGACLALLRRADVAYFLPGWEDSRGCQIEHDYCQRSGIEIVYISETDLA